jgi:AbrB family looped-hinge helix DNA binding protein
MKEFVATVTSRGRVTIPVEVRRHLGLEPGDQVAFTIDGGIVRLQPPRFTLETVIGSVEPLPRADTDDFDAQIAEAMEDAAERRLRKLGLA